jgi:predicted DNA-binding antitoxin AbrB/MazE fold protein
MTLTVEATFENGQLKFKEPLAIVEGTAVRVTITPVTEEHDPFADIIGICHSGRTDGAANHDQYLKGKRPQ